MHPQAALTRIEAGIAYKQMEATNHDVDAVMMQRCIALATRGVDLGEYPYAAVVCRDGKVISESMNAVRRDQDVEPVTPTRRLRQLSMHSRQAVATNPTLQDAV